MKKSKMTPSGLTAAFLLVFVKNVISGINVISVKSRRFFTLMIMIPRHDILPVCLC